MTHTLVAVDLGATSGRVIAGVVSPSEIHHEVVHRFPNGPVQTGDSLHWNVTGLFEDILTGLTKVSGSGAAIASIGVDSWGVDYGLLSAGNLVNEPFHYRDSRTAQGVASVHAGLPFDQLFDRNGLQFMPINTIYQLAAENWDGESGTADVLLMIPDLVNFWLTGTKGLELTNASTTGFLSASTGELDPGLIALTGAPASLFGRLHEPGHRLGRLLPEVSHRVGSITEVVAVASHDTASAVVATPMRTENSAYISCGTWGLVGVEAERPILSQAARDANFTNEIGLDRRIRFLRNVMGLWLLNESVGHWNASGGSHTVEDLVARAADYTGALGVFDVNDPVFMAPGDMPHRIETWLAQHDQAIPEGTVGMVASIIESLARAFAATVRDAGELSGKSLVEINMVGGGSQNPLLCQKLANHAGIPVIAGPVEATAVGNLLVQARSQGVVSGDLDALRALVRQTFSLVTYVPQTPQGPKT